VLVKHTAIYKDLDTSTWHYMSKLSKGKHIFIPQTFERN
jgi:hypothetical protein